MTYIQYLIIFLLFAYGLSLCLYFFNSLKKDHFYKLVIKSFVRKQEKKDSGEYFSSHGLKKIIEYLVKKRKKKALIYLGFGRPGLAYAALGRQKALKAVLEAHTNISSAIKIFEREFRANPKDSFIAAELASLHFLEGNAKLAKYYLEKIKDKKACDYAVAKKHYYLARLAMEKGDMAAASDSASLSAKSFKKAGAYVEEGRAYVLIGTIYQTIDAKDIAYFMFKTAAEIFKKAGLKNEEAAAVAYMENCSASSAEY